MSTIAKPGDAYRNQVRASVTNQECVSAYDKWATTYDEDIGADIHGYIAPGLVAQLAANCANNLSKSIILDAGCGTGMVGRALKKQGANIIDGIDFSEGMLEVARQTGIYRDLAQEDLTKPISQPDDIYDVVTCSGTLTVGHVGPVPALAEFVRVTKKGGVIVTTILADVWESAGFKAEIDRMRARNLVSVISDDVVDYVKGYGDKAILLAMKKTDNLRAT